MVKKELTYYSLTLKNIGNALEINGKVIPVIGVYVTDGSLLDILSAKKIEENLENKVVDYLSYTDIRQLPSKEAKELEKYIHSLTIDDRTKYVEKLSTLEEDIKDNYYLNSSFGIGDMMTRRLLAKSKKKDN